LQNVGEGTQKVQQSEVRSRITTSRLCLDGNVLLEEQDHSMYKNLTAFSIADAMECGQADLARHRKGRPKEVAPSP
jgi:hypothetical protein